MNGALPKLYASKMINRKVGSTEADLRDSQTATKQIESDPMNGLKARDSQTQQDTGNLIKAARKLSEVPDFVVLNIYTITRGDMAVPRSLWEIHLLGLCKGDE